MHSKGSNLKDSDKLPVTSNSEDSNKLQVTSYKLKTKNSSLVTRYSLLSSDSSLVTDKVTHKVARRSLFICLLVTCYLLFVTVPSSAGLIDRVVAYVDDTAITLSEFEKNYVRMKKTVSAISEDEVLNSMINSLLLLKEAKKMRIEAPTKDEILKDYVDVKIKSAIIIREEDVERFYNEHREDFKGKDYIYVRDEIERYLFELETNRQLKKHLEELRSHTEIRIQPAMDAGQ